MGVQAWLRSFNGLNIFSFLPQAIAWTRARAGHEVAEKRFLWITKWWANIFGWTTSVMTIMLYISLIVEGDLDLFTDFLSFRGRKNWWKKSKKSKGKGDDDLEEYAWMIVGITGITVEVASWIIFYLAYGKSMAYGAHLLTQTVDEAIAEDDSEAGI